MAETLAGALAAASGVGPLPERPAIGVVRPPKPPSSPIVKETGDDLDLPAFLRRRRDTVTVTGKPVTQQSPAEPVPTQPAEVPDWLEDLRKTSSLDPREVAIKGQNGESKSAAEPPAAQYPVPPRYFAETVIHAAAPIIAQPEPASQPAPEPARSEPVAPPDWLDKLPDALRSMSPTIDKPLPAVPDWLEGIRSEPAGESAPQPAEPDMLPDIGSVQPSNIQVGYQRKDLTPPSAPIVDNPPELSKSARRRQAKAARREAREAEAKKRAATQLGEDERSRIEAAALAALSKPPAPVLTLTSSAPSAGTPSTTLSADAGRKAAQSIADTWTGMVNPKPPDLVLTEPAATPKETAEWPSDVWPAATLDEYNMDMTRGINIENRPETAGGGTNATLLTPDQQFISGLVGVGLSESEAAKIRQQLDKLPVDGRPGYLKLILEGVIKDENPVKIPILAGIKTAELLLALQPTSVEANPAAETANMQTRKDRIISLLSKRKLSFMRGEASIKAPNGKDIGAQDIEQLLGVGEDGKVTPDHLVADLLHIVDGETSGLSDLIDRCQTIVDREDQITAQIGQKRSELEANITVEHHAGIEKMHEENERLIDLAAEQIKLYEEAALSSNQQGISAKERVLRGVVEGDRLLVANQTLKDRAGLLGELKASQDLYNSDISALTKTRIDPRIFQLSTKLNGELLELRENSKIPPRVLTEFKGSGFKNQTEQTSWIRGQLEKWARLANPVERTGIIEQIAAEEINFERRIDSVRAQIPTDIKQGDYRSQKVSDKKAKEAEIEKLNQEREVRLAELRRDLLPSTEGLDGLRTSLVGRLYADMVKVALHTVRDTNKRLQSVRKEGLERLTNFSGLETEIQAKVAELKAQPQQAVAQTQPAAQTVSPVQGEY